MVQVPEGFGVGWRWAERVDDGPGVAGLLGAPAGALVREREVEYGRVGHLGVEPERAEALLIGSYPTKSDLSSR